MGELIDLNPRSITDADIPSAIARDSEVSAAIAAHTAAADPHPVYLNQSEGDARYRQAAVALTDADIPSAIARDAEVSAAIAAYMKPTTYTFNGPLSFPANQWSTIDAPQGFSLGNSGASSAWLIALHFQHSSTLWHQYCCACIASFTWWGANNAGDPGQRLFVDAHNFADFYIELRATSDQGSSRKLQIKPETTITISSGGKLDVVIKPLL